MTLYAVPMLSSAEVAFRLSITQRRALQLMRSHPSAAFDGVRWLLPLASLDDLRARNTKRGRPKKTVAISSQS